MKTFQKSFGDLESLSRLELEFQPDLILLFISPEFKDHDIFVKELSERYPDTIISGCSTSGEIMDVVVSDNSIVLNAIAFEKTEVRMVSRNIADFPDSRTLGEDLMKQFSSEDLQHVLVFSEGLLVNGDDLIAGITSEVKPGVGVTGGLAGDGTNFNRTFVIKNDKILLGEVVAIGLYGTSLKIGFSSRGGWNSFGIERRVTKSDKHVLYEIDGQPALQLYKSFLGDKADELPGSGLLFPLSVRLNEDSIPLVRTLLTVNEEDQSIVFAGNIPEGAFIRLMKANVNRLIDGAEDSAELTKNVMKEDAEFALLISCVGRRVVLKQLVEEEIEAVREVLGSRPAISGFYSYGELAPFDKDQACQLHNQTMTITTFSEV